MEIRGPEGTLLVLDAGSGILRLGATLPASTTRVDILLTHLHLDHIIGLGFFGPLRNQDCEVHIWGPASTTYTLKERLSHYLSPPLFPVYIRDMQSTLEFHEIATREFEIGEFKISSAPVIHYDPTLGFRITTTDATVTYLPDHEPALGVVDFPMSGEWTSGYSLAAGADILIHDAQYTQSEYLDRVGWGHSSIPDAYKFATMADVKHLIPFHHDPGHKDSDLDRMFSRQLRLRRLPFIVTPGAEGMSFELG
ncbi:MAG: MBL fold metallo-hydrolase [Candidatus Neomarinimicrobiota bacterium]